MNDPVNPNHIGDDSVASTRMTTQSSLSSLAPKTAQRTSLGHRFQRALTGGPNRRFPGLHPSPGGAASLSLFLNRRLALPIFAILALLAASLLFLLPGSPLQAQDDGTIEYAENGTDPVATYTAVDPEGAAIAWSLSGDDKDDFTIAGGVLAFVKSPDFEDPKDDTADNIYEIMVEATDGTGHVGRKTVMVEVTNVDEDGTVSLSALQPAPNVAFTATLTDIDNTDANPATAINGLADLSGSAEWQWSKSQSTSSGWTDIDKATSKAYTPDEDGGDSGYYLRATAKYKDKQSPSGADNDKTAFMVSANKVLVLRSSNEVPKFADVQDPLGINDNAKAIAKRTVAETAEAGQLVGDPVTAEDGDALDVLTYTLVNDAADDNFVIDRATGQISVAKGAEFDVPADENIAGVAQMAAYTVTVIATDPKGIPTKTLVDGDNATFRDIVMVMISVTPVDEPPIFTDTGVTSVTFNEVTGIDDGNVAGLIATPLSDVYEANDPETQPADAPVTLRHRGADSSKFDFTEGGVLTFKAKPDFEKPADADKDNVYEVTITATDGTANMATRDVKVTVTNAEELGEVTLSQPRPRVGLAITAGYSDPDGGLASATWQWWRTVSTDPTTDNRPDLLEEADEYVFVPADGLMALDGGVWVMIPGATSATYTPVFDDADPMKSDAGRYLVAVVSYTDAKQNMATVPTTRDMARLVSAYPAARDTRNRAPVFEDQDSDTPGTQNQTATREVAENTKAEVGSAVTAKDPDPNDDTLTYTLSGADAGLFSVAELGQIKVKSATKPDFEAAKNVYMVTLTATDSFSDSASIDVTIMVTDADEPPDVSGDVSAEYAENGTGSVATYTAEDPEGAAVKWSLSGTDASLFSIEGGVLAFVKSPNFEDAKDEMGTPPSTALAEDNIYEIMVEATDGTGHVGRKAVKVEVTNVDEDGTVELSALQPAPNVDFTAALTDIDNGPTALTDSAEWQWSRSTSRSSGWNDIDKATGSTYEPDENGGDSGYYLRATAKYEDRQSPSGADKDKTASMISANKVLVLRSSNKVPEFADAVDGEDTYGRAVAETATAGQLVGDPVTAEDGDTADVLTYTLVNDDADDNFVIDRATGQISVAKDAKFNVEDDADIADVTDENDYTVTVIATDPKGIPTKTLSDNDNAAFRNIVMVMISVTPVDEPPIFTDTGVTSVTFDESTVDIAAALSTYGAVDPEGEGDVTLGIRGADSSKFDFNTTSRELTFKAAAAPDFEKPADADKDNIYEVTITATDGNANMATKDVKVTVTNAEEPGEVTLSQPTPRVGLAITASYTDPDGGLASATWQWWRTGEVITDTAPELPTDLTSTVLETDGVWEMIAGATSASYMPVVGDVEADSDVGRYLLAVVSYTDAKRNLVNDEFNEDARDMAGKVSVNPVALDTRNRAPVFRNDDGEMIASTTREVAENTNGIVGNAVTAEDPDPNADPLIYALSGADAALFSVGKDDPTTTPADEGGRITVKSGTKLDFEAAKNVYMVTITATDSFTDSASIDVTIMVTDVDEAPRISEGGLAIAGSASESYAEDRRDAVATYSATGPESANATWTLGGDDAGDFRISSSGELTFRSAPDFENAADADTDNLYEVTVEADDGTYMATRNVEVTVTDVDEDGTVSLSSQAPVVGIALTASLTDADGEITGVKWQWASENTDGTFADIAGAGATSGSYTPADADVGKRLRATASYTDGHGSSKSAMAESANAVSTTPTTVAGGYDADGSGTIDRTEVGQAVRDFIGGQIEHDDVVQVIAQYFKDLRSGS